MLILHLSTYVHEGIVLVWQYQNSWTVKPGLRINDMKCLHLIFESDLPLWNLNHLRAFENIHH